MARYHVVCTDMISATEWLIAATDDRRTALEWGNQEQARARHCEDVRVWDDQLDQEIHYMGEEESHG